MPPLPVLPHLLRSSTSLQARRLERAAAEGRLIRVHPGVYVRAADWAGLLPEQKHVLQVQAASTSLLSRLVFSHESAAAAHGLPFLSGTPKPVHVTDPERERGQRWAGVVKHAGPLSDSEIEVVDGVQVTTLARTCVDVALTCLFADGLAMVDAALASGIVTHDDLVRLLADRPTARRRASACRLIEFGSPKAGSAGESLARLRLFELGAPQPSLQEPFDDADGLIGFVDLWWEEFGIALEFDGDHKYTNPRYANGRTPAQIALDERKRERRLLAHPRVRTVVRSEWRDLLQPIRLRSALAAEGLPFGRPRPTIAT